MKDDELSAFEFENAAYFARQIENMISSGVLKWTFCRFGAPEYGSILSDDNGRGAISQFFSFESVRDSQRIAIEITEFISVRTGTIKDKGNLNLTLWITNPEMSLEYHFSLDQIPGYDDLPFKKVWNLYKDNPFVLLADIAIKNFTENYINDSVNIRKHFPYIENEFQKYRGLPIVRLGSKLRKKCLLYLFHECVLYHTKREAVLTEYSSPIQKNV